MDCYACTNNAATDLPSRERVLRTEHWRVAHAFDSALPGWLVLVPTTHVLRLDELNDEALVELGLLQGRLSAALRDVAGAAKTYLMQFSEAPDFQHLHVHLVARMPHEAQELVGPAVFGYLGADEATRVPTDVMDRLCDQIRAEVSLPAYSLG